MSLFPQSELHFQLYECLDTESLLTRSRFAEHSIDTFNAVLDTAEKIAMDLFLPHNAAADQTEPQFDGQTVTMLDDVKVAYDAFCDAGFVAARFDFEDGGMQLPETIMTGCSGFFMAANPSTTAYPFLTTAAANVIKHFASESLQTQFLPKMLTGEFSGTMALTEPHAGSGLADITTAAQPTEHAHYLIKGSKLYISGGDHQLSSNIVHLVLAKIPGGPAGVKGISLFIVPKFRLDDNGHPTTQNDVTLAGLIHKLGYRGTTSTALTFGENDDCHGYLVGEPHKGLQYMFMMMNEARVGVGFGAAMIGYRGFQYSLAYAKERLQGGKSIVEHGDVKRMLLLQKSYSEGALNLCFYGARLVDDMHTHEDESVRQGSAQLLDLLTPVIKAWPSEYGPKANDLAIQVMGGAGYTREYPVEQFWRDNRLNPIHEGTNGIQALDLMGRKLWQNNQAGLIELQNRFQQDLGQATGHVSVHCAKAITPFLAQLAQIIELIGQDLQSEEQTNTLTNAMSFMEIFSSIIISWMWLRQVIVAEQTLHQSVKLSSEQESFYQGKCQTGLFYIQTQLPLIQPHFDLLTRHDNSCSVMQTTWF